LYFPIVNVLLMKCSRAASTSTKKPCHYGGGMPIWYSIRIQIFQTAGLLAWVGEIPFGTHPGTLTHHRGKNTSLHLEIFRRLQMLGLNSVHLVATVAQCTYQNRYLSIGKPYTFLRPYLGIICCGTKTTHLYGNSTKWVRVKSIRFSYTSHRSLGQKQAFPYTFQGYLGLLTMSIRPLTKSRTTYDTLRTMQQWI